MGKLGNEQILLSQEIGCSPLENLRRSDLPPRSKISHSPVLIECFPWVSYSELHRTYFGVDIQFQLPEEQS